MGQYKRMGDMLLDQGLVSAEQLETALNEQRQNGKRFGETIVALGFVTEDQIAECLAGQYGYDLADLDALKPDPSALALVTPIYALSHLVLPVGLDAETLSCVIADPLDLPMTDDLAQATRRRLRISVAAPSKLYDRIVRAYDLPTATGSGPRAPHLTVESSDPPRIKTAPKIRAQSDRETLLDLLADNTAAAQEKKGRWPFGAER